MSRVRVSGIDIEKIVDDLMGPDIRRADFDDRANIQAYIHVNAVDTIVIAGSFNSCAAAKASMRPAPKVLSAPGLPKSTALFIKALRISSAVVNPPLRRAATPATCGAEADVPKKGVGKPPAPVTDTPSIAVTSGFSRIS